MCITTRPPAANMSPGYVSLIVFYFIFFYIEGFLFGRSDRKVWISRVVLMFANDVNVKLVSSSFCCNRFKGRKKLGSVEAPICKTIESLVFDSVLQRCATGPIDWSALQIPVWPFDCLERYIVGTLQFLLLSWLYLFYVEFLFLSLTLHCRKIELKVNLISNALVVTFWSIAGPPCEKLLRDLSLRIEAVLFQFHRCRS